MTIIVVVDVTEEVLLEEKTKSAEARLWSSLNTMGQPFALFSAEDRLVLCNEKYRETLGTRADKIVTGMTYREIFELAVDERIYDVSVLGKDEFIEQRVQRHQNPTGPYEVEWQDGRIVQIIEEKLPTAETLLLIIDVTARRKAEEELRTSERRIRAFAESASDWYWETDAENRYTWFSERVEDYTQFPREWHYGKSRIELGVQELDAAGWQSHIDDIENRRAFRNFEFCRIAPDGERWVRSSGVPVYEPDGTFRGYRGTGTDISREVNAERAADEAKALLAAAIEGLHEAFSLWGPDDRLIVCNEEFRRQHTSIDAAVVPGTSFEDFISAGIEHGIFPEAKNREAAWKSERLRNHHTPTGPTEIAQPDGGWQLVQEEKLSDGSTVSISLDISARKTTEIALRESEQRYKDFAESSSDWVWETDEHHCFTYVAKRYKDLTGFEPTFFVGKTRQDVSREPTENKKWSDYQKRLDDCAPFRNFVYNVSSSEGEIVAVNANGKPVFDEHNVFRGYRGTATDVTEQALAEEARTAALETAERANKEKSKFLARMSHELRTPLNAILGFSDVLYNQYFGPPGSGKYKEYAHDIHSSAEHLLDLVNDLLDISAIEAGNLQLQREPIDIKAIMDDCIHTVESKADLRHVNIRTILPIGLPPVSADRRAIKQILLNLISNAVKFTSENGEIRLKVEEMHGICKIEIMDTGDGISPQALERIAEPFEQGEADPYQTEKGWGLGLAITKSLVELHDGSIEIRSQLGNGTTVTVSLPIEVRTAA
jgi:two-component system cell cycle sensor histidine kinase PleC